MDAHTRVDVDRLEGLETQLETNLGADLRSEAQAMLAAVTGTAPAQRAPLEPIGLTEEQQSILDFERLWWRQAGAKEQAIRDNFEISPTRYYQQLNALLDLPEALSYDPTLINRLQRLRATTSRSRRLR